MCQYGEGFPDCRNTDRYSTVEHYSEPVLSAEVIECQLKLEENKVELTSRLEGRR